ncbi:hypothetical protein [Geothrix sp. SG200]|uniref:hypothetical protein n=1 Tax=Geothrix sp. SG200 TaxID=2922865 RepID=UPI001FAE49B2|nr:hypothetical protein [Geothrix sp. SG200]
MQRIDRFTLEEHKGPYDSWGGKSKLLLDGVPTGLNISGYSLLHQIQIPEGYLLVTDFDCPWEETTCFTHISTELKYISSDSFSGTMYGSDALTDFVLMNNGVIRFVLEIEGPLELTFGSRNALSERSRMTFTKLNPDDYLAQLKDSDKPIG